MVLKFNTQTIKNIFLLQLNSLFDYKEIHIPKAV